MAAPNPAPRPPSRAAAAFLEHNTLRSIFGIPEEALDAVMAIAYQMYQAGRFAEVEVLCRGLVAADHKYWWSYSLYAAALRRLGRLQEALVQIEKGLTYEPDAPKLLYMLDELRQAVAAQNNPQAA